MASIQRQASLLIASLLSLVAVTITFPISDFDFLKWEDSAYVLQNPIVADGLSISAIKGALFAAPEANWMPLTWLTMAAQSNLTVGSSPQALPFRVFSLVLHSLSGLLLWLLLRRNVSTSVAIIATGAFLVHPQRVESVAWISSQKDLLATFFILASALAFGHATRTFSHPWRILSVILFTASLLSKPSAVSAPLIIILSEMIRGKPWRKCLIQAYPFLIVSFIVSILSWRMNTSEEMLFDPTAVSLLQRLTQPFALISHHLFTIGVPIPTAPEITMPIPIWPWVLSGSLIVLAVSAAIRFPALRCLTAPMLAWIILLLPVSGLVPLPMAFTSDRMNHLPSLALSFFIAGLLQQLIHRSHKVIQLASILVSLVLLTAWAYLARQQTQHWQDDETLFRHILSIHPNHAIAHVNLGVLSLEKNDTASAIHSFQSATKGDRPLFSAWNNLLTLQLQQKKHSAAITTAQDLSKAFPKRAESWFLLGTAHLENLDPQAALTEFLKAHTLRPDSLMILNAIRRCLILLGRNQEASEIQSNIPVHLRK